MKRRILLAAIVLLTGWGGFAAARADGARDARTFVQGVEAYRQGDWPGAIAAFEHLASAGIASGPLFYNLGNAYLKNDDIGHARLWYERALAYMPRDPDLRFNLDHLLTLLKEEPAQTAPPLGRILFFWNDQLRPADICWIALGLNAALWTVLGILVVRKKRLLRPTSLLIGAVALIFTATAAFNYVASARIRYAVILPEKVAVRSGFTATATALFVLHAGTKVRVERESDTHRLIRFTEDKIGWVKKTDAGAI